MTDSSTTKTTLPDAQFPVGHTFDVDTNTGFMAPYGPPARLPRQWEEWEATLDAAMEAKLQLGDKPGISEQDMALSHGWRVRVRQVGDAPGSISTTL